jgi:acyl carrier protein
VIGRLARNVDAASVVVDLRRVAIAVRLGTGQPAAVSTLIARMHPFGLVDRRQRGYLRANRPYRCVRRQPGKPRSSGKTPLSGGWGAANGAAFLASQHMTASSGPPPVSHIGGVGELLNDGIASRRSESGTQRTWLPAVPTRNISHATTGDVPTRNSVVTLEAVTQQIIDLVGKDLGAVDLNLTADSSLQSQALDSLEVMVLVFKIEEHYDIVLDEEDADDLRTVGDLAALVVRRIEQQR